MGISNELGVVKLLVSGSDPSSMNGGSAMAMAGKGCVALAVDKRFGSGPQMVNISPRRVLILHSRLMMSLAGLEGDVISVSEELSVQASKYTSRGSSFGFRKVSNTNNISPSALSSLTSHVLYSRRSSPFYVEPIIVGLESVPKEHRENDDDDATTNSDNQLRKKQNGTVVDRQYRPFMCTQDLIGAQSRVEDFCCVGVASNSMYGTAEAMWRPNMDARTLGRVCGRAFLAALERDCLSGYGAIVYVMSDDGKIEMFELDTRND